MHLGMRELLDFQAAHRDDAALVLVQVVDTEGSSYRKPGAMMLISRDHAAAGLISGGCLEGDIVLRAEEVFADGIARLHRYDLHDEQDGLLGLGLGCDGVIHLLLHRLVRAAHQGLFGLIREAFATRRAVCLATITEAGADGLALGTVAAGWAGEIGSAEHGWGEPRLVKVCRERADAVVDQAHSSERYRHMDWQDARLGLTCIEPPPEVLLCGAGPDAVPLAQQLVQLGWRCRVVDHRPAYASQNRFPGGVTVHCCRPETLCSELDIRALDAAVIMSHNLEHDANYLRQLKPAAEQGCLRYLGCLGPLARRQKLLNMAGCTGVNLHGPIGLDIGAELPESIALSVAAEIHAVFNGRDGQSLSRKGQKGRATGVAVFSRRKASGHG